MDRLPCEVVRDLLPLYADDLVSETTGEMIKEHIAGCSECRSRYEKMTEPEAVYSYDPASDAEGRKEIAFLKKTRRNYLRNVLICMLAALLVFGGLLYHRYCLVGEYMSGDWVACEVSVDGKQITVEGTVTAMGEGARHKVKEVQFEENNGVVYANTIGVRTLMPLSADDRLFDASYTAGDDIDRVVLNDVIVWDGGTRISRITSSLYQTRHDYVGDASMNGFTAEVLNLRSYFGAFENDLTTDAEPYRWTIILNDEIKASNGTVLGNMTGFAYAMLGVVGNLDEVEFRYTMDGIASSSVFTREEASEFLGSDVKGCMDSPALLERLLEMTGLTRYGFNTPGSSVQPAIDEGSVVNFNVHVATDDPIKEIGVNCYIDGELRSSQHAMNADGSDLVSGDIMDFSFINRDIGDESMLRGRSIVIEAEVVNSISGKTYTIPDRYVIAPGQVNIHFFLSGSAEEGYKMY
ncbi:MAG: DUF4825 domain-containing protein [Firmicutes bacterium]|nr:DUF4825 domain-containing protein [Bacillota bacterium]